MTLRGQRALSRGQGRGEARDMHGDHTCTTAVTDRFPCLARELGLDDVSQVISNNSSG